MHRCALVLGLAAVATLAQEAAQRRALVQIEVTDRAVLRAKELKERRGAVHLLQNLTIQQPYTMLLSGIVVSAEGEILTTAIHPRAELRVLVTLHDGTRAEASLLGNDPLGNVALIRVPVATPAFVHLNEDPVEAALRVDLRGHRLVEARDATGTVVETRVPVGMADRYGINGDRHYCIGSAFLVASATAGFNPGSACLDESGRLRGMVVGCVPRAAPAPGRDLTFVLPASRLARLVRDLRQHARVVRAHFGLHLVPASEAVRAHVPGLPESACTVVEVDREGPAGRAGVRRGDLVVGVDGKEYRDPCELGETLTDRPPHVPVKLNLLRARAPLELTVTPSER